MSVLVQVLIAPLLKRSRFPSLRDTKAMRVQRPKVRSQDPSPDRRVASTGCALILPTLLGLLKDQRHLRLSKGQLKHHQSLWACGLAT